MYFLIRIIISLIECWTLFGNDGDGDRSLNAILKKFKKHFTDSKQQSKMRYGIFSKYRNTRLCNILVQRKKYNTFLNIYSSLFAPYSVKLANFSQISVIPTPSYSNKFSISLWGLNIPGVYCIYNKLLSRSSYQWRMRSHTKYYFHHEEGCEIYILILTEYQQDRKEGHALICNTFSHLILFYSVMFSWRYLWHWIRDVCTQMCIVCW